MTDDTFPLKGSALQNWLRTSGQGIFTSFDSGAAGLEYLRSQGVSIANSTFYDIRRQVLGLQRYQEQVQRIDGDNLIPMAYHVDDHGLQLSQDFLYRVKVSGTMPGTNDQTTKYFAITSNEQLTPNEVMDALSVMIEGESVFYEINAEDYTITAALAKPGVKQ